MHKVITLLALAAGAAQAQATATWDDVAAKEIEAFARQTFQAWQAQDVDAIRASMASEGGLGAYDNDMNGVPVRIRNADEQVRYARQMFDETSKMGATSSFEIRAINCRATQTAGVCAIEFDASMAMPVGGKQVWPVRATLVARKGTDGWKATHWHSSAAQAPAPAETMSLGPSPIPALNMDPKALTWKDLPNTGGVKIAPLWENPDNHGSASLVQFPKKWKIGRHYHNAGLHAVVLKGSLKTTGEGGGAEEGKVGAWTFDPAKWIHTTESKRGATILMITDGPFDVVMVDDKGNPVSAPAASTAVPAK